MSRLTLLSATLALLVALSSAAQALECPVEADIDDPATLAKVEQILPDDIDLEAPDAIESAVFELEQAGIAEDVILDNLIAVHCRKVDAETGLSDDDKTQRVEAFSERAEQLVFSDRD